MKNDEQESPLTSALRQFEAAEANLVKLERLWQEIEGEVPQGVVFGDDPEYEDRCRAFDSVLSQLPKINGWKPEKLPLDLNDIAQSRLDAWEIGEFEAKVWLENEISAPGREIREYRFRFNQKRRELIRDSLAELIDLVDAGCDRPAGHTRLEEANIQKNI